MASAQHDLFTTGQVRALGAPTQMLKRLAGPGGPWTRHGRGVYRLNPARDDPHRRTRVAWLILDRKTTVADRLSGPSVRASVGLLSAVHLYGLGPEPTVPEFVACETVSREYRDDKIVHRCRDIRTKEITVVHDMTVTTVERTLRDLILRRTNPDLVVRFAVDAAHAGLQNPAAVAAGVAPVLAAGARTMHDGPLLLLKIAVVLDYLPPFMRANRMRSTAWFDALSVPDRTHHLDQALRELLTAAAEHGPRSRSTHVPALAAPPCDATPFTEELAKRSVLAWPIGSDERDLLGYGDADGYGRFGILDDDGETVLCHECGARLKGLAAHVARRHGISVRDFKIRHGLPLGQPLLARATRGKQARGAQARTPAALRPPLDGTQLASASGAHPVYRSARRSRAGREQLAAGSRRTVHTCAFCGAQWVNRRTGITRKTCSEPCRRRLAALTAKHNRHQRRSGST
ncbi:MucR family transcriptional regulator [Nocardia blacklockiae]|uniref:MucR family transcriptional regulator n=1 Tax=Nocardia blacklockiae TaxID=480036 RepID=UPI001893A105|nr:MucR family transcriptional regulator [Nocardia blacklockiae]MBF6173589.1 MucR family transcriptional regulator [Nocardia blacklockiae]